MPDSTYEQLYALLAPHKQQHLLQFWRQLTEAEQQSLAVQIRSLNLELITRLWREREAPRGLGDLAGRIAAPPAYGLHAGNDQVTPERAHHAGEAALRAGVVGIAIVAGGQGTRLGFPLPKGMYPIGAVSGATLFQILFEKVLAISKRFQVQFPVYLMTSPATHQETLRFLNEHNRFGLAEENLRVFCQGVMPAMEAQTGKLVLSNTSELSLTPDGHGGMLDALLRNSIFDDMHRRGIEQIFYLQVDNPLVPLADPECIGYHLLSESQATTLVVRKYDPRERVGVVATIDGKLRIVEYSDLTDEQAEMKNADGALVLWAGNIAIHVFDVKLLEEAATGKIEMPFHYARKKVVALDRDGRRVETESPNVIKFERFIFDLLPAARRSIAVEVDRKMSFAPVKNAPGEPHDSPDTVQSQMGDIYRRWLLEAGVHVDANTNVEISPLYALDADELRQRIPNGFEVRNDFYLA